MEILKTEILKLGGNEADFQFLKDVEDPEDEEWENKNPQKTDDDFNLAEFQKFYSSLNFKSAQISEKPKEPQKPEKIPEVEKPAPPPPPPKPTPPPAPKEPEIPAGEIKSALENLGKFQNVKLRKSPILKFGEEENTWFEALDELYTKCNLTERFRHVEPLNPLVKQLRERGSKLITHEATFTEKITRKFVNTAAESGTARDKAAALTLKIQANPVANHDVLEQLLRLAKKKVRRDFMMSGSLLRDVLISDLLPGDRQLYLFHQRTDLLLWVAQNMEKIEASKALLLMMYEDRLKQSFSEYISILESTLSDPVEKMKLVSLEISKSLLEVQPECEDRLLTILINKLGDQKPKVVQKSIKLLNDLLRQHPNMQEVISYEVESFLYRPNQEQSSILAAISFLNQFVFSSDRHEIPTRLLNLYFEFFTSEVKKSQNKMSQKILLSLLTGVNRAFPFAHRSDDDSIQTNINHLFKLVHNGTFIVALQSLSFLFQAFNTREELGDRFYNSLYSLLLRPEMSVETKRHPMLLNLIYRTMSNDKIGSRQNAFIKRMLAMSTVAKTPLQAGCLVLLAQLLSDKPQLRSITDDPLVGRKSTIGGTVVKPVEAEDSDDEEENFKDADKPDEEVKTAKVGWDHRGIKKDQDYDPWARNPSYCGAETEKTWELVSMSDHFHPSVALFANNILDGSEEKYPGDPLSDFTIIRFLDRFVYKNPKARDQPKSINVNKRRVNRYLDTTQLPVTSLEFLKAKEKDLAPQDKFMQRFFKLRSSGGQKVESSAEISSTSADLEDVSDDEFEAILEDKEKGWENRIEQIDYSLATPKQRKQIKKRLNKEGNGDEDLDDEEVDLGKLYSDESEDEMTFGEELSEDETLPEKRKKLEFEDRTAESFGEILDETTTVSKQHAWEENGKSGKKFKSKERKRNSKMKKSSILNRKK